MCILIAEDKFRLGILLGVHEETANFEQDEAKSQGKDL
jgi:hypothetical protein